MIGCIAKATSSTLHVDETEMDDVRWVSREVLQKAVQDSQRMDTPYHGEAISRTLACRRVSLAAHHIVSVYEDALALLRWCQLLKQMLKLWRSDVLCWYRR